MKKLTLLLAMSAFLGTLPVCARERTSTIWEIPAQMDSVQVRNWTEHNRLYATQGDYAGKAFLSVASKDAVNGGPKNPTIQGLKKDDAIAVTLPKVTLPAGSSVDFLIMLRPDGYDTPKYFLFEYFDEGRWKSVDEDLLTAADDPGTRYSTCIKHFVKGKPGEHGAVTVLFTQSFTLSKGIKGKALKMRLRAVGNINNGGSPLEGNNDSKVCLNRRNYLTCAVATYTDYPVKDTLSLLTIGNSFTYYYSYPYILKELARSQGHLLKIRSHTLGGQYLRDHLYLEMAQDYIRQGGYDYAFLQDQTVQHARWTRTRADSIVQNTRTLAYQILTRSPKVQLVVENTWSYSKYPTISGYTYTDQDTFDADLQKGALHVARSAGAWLSPVNEAFRQARREGISLYISDNHHANRNGMYLKSCVNYLLLFGVPFDENAADCCVDASVAKRLREIAEEVVLNHLQQYRNPQALE